MQCGASASFAQPTSARLPDERRPARSRLPRDSSCALGKWIRANDPTRTLRSFTVPLEPGRIKPDNPPPLTNRTERPRNPDRNSRTCTPPLNTTPSPTPCTPPSPRNPPPPQRGSTTTTAPPSQTPAHTAYAAPSQPPSQPYATPSHNF